MTIKLHYVDDYKSTFSQFDGDGRTVEVVIPECGHTSDEVLEAVYSFLVAVGYHPTSVAESMRDLADERLPREH